MKKYQLYGLGAALVDFEHEVSDDFIVNHNIEKGLMTLVDEASLKKITAALDEPPIKKASGGSAANSMIAASFFGSSVFYSCKAADDPTGKFFLHDLEAAGVDCNLRHAQHGGTSGHCLVMVTPDAERTMHTFLGVSEHLSENELCPPVLEQSDYFYIEGYLATSTSGRQAAIKGKNHADQHDVKTVLTFSDPSMVQYFKAELLEMIGDGVEHIFCNEEEALLFTACDSLDEAAKVLTNYCNTFAVTLGKKGAWVFDGKDYFHVTSPKVKALDTNGAGDMFAGAFLHALSEAYDFEKAASFACQAASKVVQQFGPRLKKEICLQLKKQLLSEKESA